jgi:hypothetical protein
LRKEAETKMVEARGKIAAVSGKRGKEQSKVFLCFLRKEAETKMVEARGKIALFSEGRKEGRKKGRRERAGAMVEESNFVKEGPREARKERQEEPIM